MSQELKPIETHYAGCRFRSRIEARWAVFFDRLGLPWEYEPQGFDLPSGPYLPDFLLGSPGGNRIWWEVKGLTPTDHERQLCWELVCASHQNAYLAHGAIPRDHFEPSRIEYPSGVMMRWYIHAGIVGVVGPRADQVGVDHPDLLSAYAAARSARFEHGESGAA